MSKVAPMSRVWALALAVAAVVVLGCKSAGGGGAEMGEAPAAPVKGWPSSMVALGDSLTTAFGSCLAPIACPRNSWATGDGTQVMSHYRRILAENPAIKGHARNLARNGATVADLPAQARSAAGSKADYVTILIGANDACRGSMTSVSKFRQDLDDALGIIKKAMPKARVLLVGIPNVYRVWEIGHTRSVALAAWKSGVCPNLLTNPTSTAKADVERRAAFRDRIASYNRQMRAACAAYGSRCRFQDTSRIAFDLDMLSALDFFHPNGAGQNALAQATYPGRFNW